MTGIFRMLLLFLIVYVGLKFVKSLMSGIMNSGKKDEFEKGRTTITNPNNKSDKPTQFTEGEYIEYEEVE